MPRLAAAACDVAEIGAIALGSRLRDIEVVGDLAYIAAGFDGLLIIDVADPYAPAIVGSLDSLGFSQDLEVVGNLVYVADSSFQGPGGLRIIDVSNPAAPFEVSRYPSSFSRVAVSGGLAFATGPSTGLRIIDVSNAASPFEVGSFDLPGFEAGMHVIGSLVYLLMDPAGSSPAVRVLDVSNPTTPQEVGSADTGPRLPFDMKIAGEVGYLPAIGPVERGLMIYDLSNPVAPVESAFLRQSNSRGIRVVGERVYFAFGIDMSFGGGLGGFRIIDVSDPTTPVDIGGADTAIDEATALAAQVKADGDRLFVTTSGPSGGLGIFHVSNCPAVVPLDVVPGSEANWVPMTVDDPIPVQILGSSSLDVANIAAASLRFGPAAAAPMNDSGFEPTVGDVNGDGFDDLVVYFHADAAGLGPYDQQACLEGQLAGASFIGCGWVSVNRPPVALIFDNPHRGIAPLWVSFDGRASSDPEGGSLLYEWEFTGWAEPASGPTVLQFLPVPGSYEATLTVEDDYGQRRTTTFVAKALDVPEVVALTPRSLAVLAMLVLFAGTVLLRRPQCVP